MDWLPHLLILGGFTALVVIPLAARRFKRPPGRLSTVNQARRRPLAKDERQAETEWTIPPTSPNQGQAFGKTEAEQAQEKLQREKAIEDYSRQVNYKRYLTWRGRRPDNTQSPAPRIPPKPEPKCNTCQGTGRIVRGHDGRVIRCPACMDRSRRGENERPPAEIAERQQSEHLRQRPNPGAASTPTPPPQPPGKYMPQKLSTSLIFWGGLLILLLVILLTNQDDTAQNQRRTNYAPPPAGSGDNIDDAKSYMLSLVNDERQKAGVPPVKLGDNQAAQLHAEEAIKGCYSSHWDRWGLKPSHRYALAGGTGADAENISGHDSCVGPGDGYRRLSSLSYEISDSVNGLMQSRGHRQTILNPAHTILNAGIAHNGYRISVVQQFSSDYVTYQKKPTINEAGTLELEASTEGASLDIGDYVNIQIYYDPPPEPLTRGQLYHTYSYCIGPQAAYIVRPRSSLPQGGTLEVEERTRIQRCTDPYDIDLSEKVPTNPAQIESHWDSIKAKALKPKEIVEHVHKVAATSLEKTDNTIKLQADLKEVLDFHGPGIYTVVLRGRPNHMTDNATIAEQALFWEITAPQGNPYEESTKQQTSTQEPFGIPKEFPIP